MIVQLRKFALYSLFLTFALANPISVLGMFLGSTIEHVPVERLITNLGLSNPENSVARAALNFKIARLYSIAYSMKTETLPVRRYSNASSVDSSPDIVLPGYRLERRPDYRQYPAVSIPASPKVEEHLRQAIKYYRAAIADAPSDENIRLGLAWCLDQAGEKSEAIKLYRKVIASVGEEKGIRDPQERAAEAAQYLIPLLDAKSDATEIAKLKSLAKPDYSPRGVTPIVIPLAAGLSSKDVMQPSHVAFDFGLGKHSYSSWPSARAGWLVYDKDVTGNIQTGYQMFGSMSFCLFWDNGYQALASLDDNHDGKLDGAELQNLAIWQDKNCDGQSDRSEVRPLAEFGITTLSCSFMVDADGVLSSEDGVMFESGETRRTYDVILQTTENPSRHQ